MGLEGLAPPPGRLRAGHATLDTTSTFIVGQVCNLPSSSRSRAGGTRTPTSAVKSRVRCRYATTPTFGGRRAFESHRHLSTLNLRRVSRSVTAVVEISRYEQ